MKNTEGLIKEIDQDARQMLSEERYQHSAHVMKKAGELAKRYGADVEKAKLVGLAHDIAKEMSKEEILKYVEEHHIIVDEYEAENLSLLHGKIGADFCKNKYDFSEDMQKAIEYHTTGEPEMDTLAKIIYIADKTEEGRKHVNFDEVEQKEEEGLDTLLLYVMNHAIIHIIEKGKTMHINTIITRNYFLNQIEK